MLAYYDTILTNKLVFNGWGDILRMSELPMRNRCRIHAAKVGKNGICAIKRQFKKY